MKNVMLVNIVLCVLLVVGCEPESATNAIAGFDEAMSDPNSTVQVTAENLKELVDLGVVIIKTVPGFPYAKFLFSALAIVQAVIAIVLSWRKHINTKALKEVVRGNEILKKGPIDGIAFKNAQNIAQSEATVELVNKIRAKVV